MDTRPKIPTGKTGPREAETDGRRLDAVDADDDPDFREYVPVRDRSIADLRKSFGDLVVLDGLSCVFPAGETTAILGPSGCGKTTLLNILSGLTGYDGGTLDGFGETRPSFVFQEPRLLPWRSVLENIVAPLERLMPRGDGIERAMHYIKVVGLKGFERQVPGKLSGGMRQRVSLARAFAYPGDPLLLDEPFQALDLKLRLEIMDLFKRLQSRGRRSAVFVTHDPQEALYLGDSIIILSGRPARCRKVLRLDPASKKAGYGLHGEAEAELYSILLS